MASCHPRSPRIVVVVKRPKDRIQAANELLRVFLSFHESLFGIGTCYGQNGQVLALTLWGWARGGYPWTTFLGPVGLVILVANNAIVRSRPKLYLLFQVLAMCLLIATTVLILR